MVFIEIYVASGST